MIPNNARHVRITAAAGTDLAMASFGANVNRGDFSPRISSPLTGVYNPKAFFLHAASLDQAFAHCPRFLVAAIRRCRDRVSVPLWLTDLSVQLPVIALVGHYPTNKLIGRRPLHRRAVKPYSLAGLRRITLPFGRLCSTNGYVPTRYSPFRLCPACARPIDLHA